MRVRGERGVVVLRSALTDGQQGRYSYVAARPFVTLIAHGSRCELRGLSRTHFGNPFCILESLLSSYELLDEIDVPFPLGGCFGYWGYDLKNFVEPQLPRRAVDDDGFADCHAGFYDSLVAFDHLLGKTWVISTGLLADGMISHARAHSELDFWRAHLASAPQMEVEAVPDGSDLIGPIRVDSNLSRQEFIAKVERAQEYIRAGDIYQVNLSHRLTAQAKVGGWEFFHRLCETSPAPFAAFLDCGDYQICSSSPESFLRFSGAQAQTRPIKGTRPRSTDSARDAQLSYELQTSAKEIAELVMITDLMRNDLGKVCEFGSVQVPELVRLERYAHVQHLVSTVAGRLRREQTHVSAFASMFPGGSVTGAPKVRAMEIIDELEPVTRGPYTGAIGYFGFNRESQLSVAIRTAVCCQNEIHFQAGAGIVADSNAAAEYEETLAKAAGFLETVKWFERKKVSAEAKKQA